MRPDYDKLNLKRYTKKGVCHMSDRKDFEELTGDSVEDMGFEEYFCEECDSVIFGCVEGMTICQDCYDKL